MLIDLVEESPTRFPERSGPWSVLGLDKIALLLLLLCHAPLAPQGRICSLIKELRFFANQDVDVAGVVLRLGEAFKTIGDKVLLEGQTLHKLRLHEDRIAAQAFQAVLRTAKGAVQMPRNGAHAFPGCYSAEDFSVIQGLFGVVVDGKSPRRKTSSA
ncbi:hypothetical protein MASR2M78_31760 [Treponema sp.]